MRQYQEEYIANTRNLIELMRHKRTAGMPPEEKDCRNGQQGNQTGRQGNRAEQQESQTGLQGNRAGQQESQTGPQGNQTGQQGNPTELQKSRAVREIRERNTRILRENLIPTLDDILTVSREDIDSLVEFADTLMRLGLDAGVRYYICKALVSYARVKEERNLLIKELYMTGMALFGLKNISGDKNDGQFCWKMQMVFGEAAGYIRIYDKIEDAETRGYIHRSMGNLALGLSGRDGKTAERKMEVIRRSLQVLTDPVYQRKTPELPWETYIYKQHQERTTLMEYLRSGEVTARIVGEVMESAQYVYDRQMENAREKGMPLEARWLHNYYAASYYCGVYTLPELLHRLEGVYASVSFADYSANGMYGNIYLPQFYSVYVSKDPEMLERKRPVVLMMYRRVAEYLKHVPLGEDRDKLFFYVRGSLAAYIEYPGDNCFLDYVKEVTAGRRPEAYAHSCRVAEMALCILEEMMAEMPGQLLGIRGIRYVRELEERREELKSFLHDCCVLRNVGKLEMLELYEVSGRSWFAEEEELHRTHPLLGRNILSRCDSTKDLAPVVLGHHRWYDGQGGFPEEYHREEEQDAVLTDIVSVADFMGNGFGREGDGQAEENGLEETNSEEIGLDELLRHLQSFSGTRFSPYVVEAAERCFFKAACPEG